MVWNIAIGILLGWVLIQVVAFLFGLSCRTVSALKREPYNTAFKVALALSIAVVIALVLPNR